MTIYRFLGVDQSLSAVAARFHTTLEQLWHLNDGAHRFHSAEEWARSVGYTEQIQVDHPPTETRWEWDLFDEDEGNISLQEFCDRRNRERQERRRQRRPVGPTLTPELLWHALPNEEFRFQQIMHEARTRGATAQDVQNLEDNPEQVYVRTVPTLGIFVPTVPAPPRRSVAAAPNGAVNVLVTMPHWLRELLEHKADIEQAASDLRALVARERGVRAEFASTLTTFARMDEFLRILIEGRSGNGEPRTYADADLSTLNALEVLRGDLYRVHMRVADLGRRRREQIIDPRAHERLSTRLRTLVQDRRFSALYRRAVIEDTHAHGERVAPQVQETVLQSYRLAVDAALPWAEQDVEAALSPPSTWWQTTAQWLPLATALVVPMFGNLAGPPSVAVWLAQWRATKQLSSVLSSTALPSALRAQAYEEVERIVCRWVQGRRSVISVQEYQLWLDRVRFQESMFNAVLANADGLPSGSFRVGSAPASIYEQLQHFDEWLGAARRNQAELHAIQNELSQAQRTLGRTSAALKSQILDVLFDANLTTEARRTSLRDIARGDLTGGVHAGNLATTSLLVLNLLAVAAGIVNYRGQPNHSDAQRVELFMNTVGGTYTSGLAVLQLLANQSEASWAANFLRVNTRLLGNIAAALALAQSIAGLVSTIDTYGSSHPMAFAGNCMAIASAGLLWAGWAGTLEGASQVLAAGAGVLSGVGLVLGLTAAALGIYANIRGEDSTTKSFFIQFVQNLESSPTIRQLDLFLADSPDGGTTFQLDLLEVRQRAQRLTFPLAVAEERSNLERLGFSINESGTLSAARATHPVGPINQADARAAFIRHVNQNFAPAH